MYETVVSILRGAPYNWPSDCAPEPTAIEEALTVPGNTPETVAARLEDFCRAQAAKIADPYGIPGAAYNLIRYRFFSRNREMWRSNTRIALGLVVEVPVPQGRVARNVIDWWANQEENVSYLGYPMLPLDDADGVKEREGRWRAALPENVPPIWSLNGLGIVYQFLVREGLNTEWRGFGYFGSERSAWDDYRNFLGLTAEMVLDNLHAARRLTGPRVKWLTGGARVEGWED